MSAGKKTVISIQGPTGIGKSSLAIKLAQKIDAEIISADSRQFYKEMTIGTAKPTLEDRKLVPHHFVDFISLTSDYNASDFEKDALKCIDDIFKRNHIPLIVGGSGLYVDALLNGFHPIPDYKPEIRERITKQFEEEGLPPLLKQLKEIDPVSYEKVDKKNFRRILRVLEVSLSANKPYSQIIEQSERKERNFDGIRIALFENMESLYSKINKRCDAMLEQGLLKEVELLYPYKEKSVLQTIGYQEFFKYLDGEWSYESALEKFKQHSRNYAKKQMTWLRRLKDITWFEADHEDQIFSYVEKEIKQL